MFVNSSPQRRLAESSVLCISHIHATPYSEQKHCDVTIDLLLHYIQEHFKKKIDGRQIAKNRHIAKQSTTRMQDILGMIYEKYLENWSINVGLDAI